MPPPPDEQAIALAGIVAILMGVLVRLASRTRPLRRRRRALRLARGEIDRHRIRLSLRRRGLEVGRWPRERIRFCNLHVKPVLDQAGLGPMFDLLRSRIEREVDQASSGAIFQGRRQDARRRPDGDGASARATPGAAYEQQCAILLRRAGWEAHLTAGSGDQGSDILARRRHRVLVVQCKRHGRPVGNKAVQEVYAAQRHHGADLAAVVSNAGYTRAARALAQTTGVRLLHHGDLGAL